MGFWNVKRKNETPEEKAARRARNAERDATTYDSIMNAFVQPLPTFSQWAAPVARGHPPTYENVAPNTYYPATYYPNQTYENPYGSHQGYQYVQCASHSGSAASSENLPTYVDSTYNPYSRQVLPPSISRTRLTQQVIDVFMAIASVSSVWNIRYFHTSFISAKSGQDG
jgi:hypothetical protein